MSIKHERIDLTEDNRFRADVEYTNTPTNKFAKIFANDKYRLITSDTELTIPKNHYTDKLSWDVGYLVRRTWDNHWFFGQYDDRSFLDLVFMDYGLVYDKKRCFCCGKELSIFHKEICCDDCANYHEDLLSFGKSNNKINKYIPWIDERTISKNVLTNDLLNS